ncbi:MAG TPA: hypothetical protein VHO29_06555 [Marmoricola sp.]|nr:hypothetical protein [Marmoricola sp.]
MKTITAAAACGAALVAGTVGVAAWADRPQSPNALNRSGVPVSKAAATTVDEQLDKANKATASDPQAVARIAAEKARDLKAHRAAQAAQPPAQAEWPTGIFEDPEAPAPGSVFLGTNRWVGNLGGQSVAVYAGRAGDDETTGRVLIAWATPSGETERQVSLDLPGAGALRVQDGAADAAVVTIRDAAGVDHQLNVASGTWVR